MVTEEQRAQYILDMEKYGRDFADKLHNRGKSTVCASDVIGNVLHGVAERAQENLLRINGNGYQND